MSGPRISRYAEIATLFGIEELLVPWQPWRRLVRRGCYIEYGRALWRALAEMCIARAASDASVVHKVST